MAKVRQPYDEPVSVPALGGRVVNPRQTVEIPDDQVDNFLAAGWKPADEAAKRAADKRDKAQAKADPQPAVDDDEPAPAGQEG